MELPDGQMFKAFQAFTTHHTNWLINTKNNHHNFLSPKFALMLLQKLRAEDLEVLGLRSRQGSPVVSREEVREAEARLLR